jgi:hypothetical protein
VHPIAAESKFSLKVLINEGINDYVSSSAWWITGDILNFEFQNNSDSLLGIHFRVEPLRLKDTSQKEFMGWKEGKFYFKEC